MIFDKVERCDSYQYGAAWNMIIDFLESIIPSFEEKKYDIQNSISLILYLICSQLIKAIEVKNYEKIPSYIFNGLWSLWP